MIEWRAEIEARYRVNPNINLTAIVNYRYDSVYDWQKRSQRGFDRGADGFPLSLDSQRAMHNYF